MAVQEFDVKKSYVYRHVRLDTLKPFYIGIGSNSDGLYKRSRKKQNRGIIWNNIVNKHDYRVDIVLDNLSWEEACEKEKEFINLYGRIDLKTGILSNRCEGGEGNSGRILTDEQRRLCSERQKGEKGYWFGKKNPNKGVPLTDEHVDRLKNAWHNRKINFPYKQETRDKISAGNKGKKHPHAEETKLQISNSLRGKCSNIRYRVEVFKYAKSIGVFNGCPEAARAIGLKSQNVYNFVNGITKHSKKLIGYSFKKMPI